MLINYLTSTLDITINNEHPKHNTTDVKSLLFAYDSAVLFLPQQRLQQKLDALEKYYRDENLEENSINEEHSLKSLNSIFKRKKLNPFTNTLS